MKKVLCIYIFWVVIINLFAIAAQNRFNLDQDTAYAWMQREHFVADHPWNPIQLHARWDSFWYKDIAANGYSFKKIDYVSNIVFFPLYPFLTRSLAVLVGGNVELAGTILSTLSTALGLIYLFKIVKELHPDINPYLPVIFLLTFPTAFFFNVMYTESLFLFLSTACFYNGLKRSFLKASIFGLFAALTRITGVLLIIPMLWEYFSYNGFKKPFNKDLIALLLIPFGTFCFFLYHYLAFGDFFLFLKVESTFGRAFHVDGSEFLPITRPAIVNLLIDCMFVVVALVTSFFALTRLRVSYGLYMIATIAIALSTGMIMSIGRYILVLFPMYILLASIKSESVRFAYSLLSTLLLSMYITLFVNGYWAG